MWCSFRDSQMWLATNDISMKYLKTLYSVRTIELFETEALIYFYVSFTIKSKLRRCARDLKLHASC